MATAAVNAVQQHRFVQQLKVFRDRLLNIDTRNPSLFLRRIVKQRSFDLAELGAEVLNRVYKAARNSGDVLLVPDKDQSEQADEWRAHLTQLYRFADARTEETGLQELCCGLCWLEGNMDAQTFVRGPLLLVPAGLKLKREGKGQGWCLQFEKDVEPQVNRAILAATRKFRGFQAPDNLSELLTDALEQCTDEAVDIHQVVTKIFADAGLPAQVSAFNVNQRIRGLTSKDVDAQGPQPLKITSYAVVGMFPQSSTALYMDMEEMTQRAAHGETNQGIVDNLLDTPADNPTENPGNTEAVDLDKVSDRQLNLVLPSDPSQDTIIVKAQKADCVVVRGPPGTGKSQVIVNLIADALTRGQRVLLVCQKRAALDVVYDRMASIGLGDAAYVIHDSKFDRAPLYRKLSKLLSDLGQEPADGAKYSAATLSQEIDQIIQQIRAIVEPLKSVSHGLQLFRLYARARRGFRPQLSLPEEVVRSDDIGLKNITELARLAKDGLLAFDAPSYPLSMRNNWSRVGHVERSQAMASLQQLIDNARKSRQCVFIWDSLLRLMLIEAVAAHSRLKNRWYRHFRPLWYRSRDLIERNRERMLSLPVDEWPDALRQGADLRDLLEQLVTLMTPDWLESASQLIEKPQDLAQVAEAMLQAVDSHFHAIQEHDQLRASISHATWQLFEDCADKLPPDTDWGDIVFHETNVRWIDEAERAYPVLRGQPFANYEKLRRLLQEKLKQKQAAVVADLVTYLRKRALIPVFAPDAQVRGNRKPSTDWNKLAYEVSKKRCIKPLRALLRDHEWPMNQVVPCWMASPEVVAEVFPLEKGFFDLVIFDEASQLAVERALPVLYRAKRVVIAGDEQQMPPSHFFEASVDDDETEDAGEEEPFGTSVKTAESLLMLAKRIYGFNYLSWHYRSQYQELIDFSNHAYYDGTLHIAANLERDSARPPICWLQEKGCWDDRKNLVEAKKAVDLLHEQLRLGRDEGDRTVGIITFNASQQEAVKDEIERRRQADADFTELLTLAENPKSGKIDDRPFVKNIENVQGDERDVIIFSVGYALDRSGVLRKQFGPLSIEGGENRLNVAVTRARKAVFVICSFDPDTLAVETSKNIGPKRFKQFLQYARAISQRDALCRIKVLGELNPAVERKSTPAQKSFDSPFEEEVYEALTTAGYTVETQWGVGGYRLDLAVVDPRDPHRFCLGVECDGATYHSGRSVRERDIARQRFLESRGWKIARVWSRNWWLNRDQELHRLRSLLPSAPHV
ncbi:MAG: AAA domain-containing protein [Planctomycetota bacterium]|nr:AAA domain-containing protein [Planctomycetota bacterium]